MRPHRAVIFDIGGVLEHTPRTGWDRTWERRLGLPPGAIDARLRDVWTAGALGTVTETAVRARVASTLGLDPAQTGAFFHDLWTEYLGTPNEDLIACARAIRPRARLGILSNSFVGAREREADRHHFDELMDVIVYSHETGVAKPDPRAYALVCERLGAAPGDCLFLDDRAGNVDGARAAGMWAWLFRGTGEAVARIGRHLLSSGTCRPSR